MLPADREDPLGRLAPEDAEGLLAVEAALGLLTALAGEAADASLDPDDPDTLDAACATLIPKMPGDM